MFSKTNYYFVSYGIEGSDFYLFAVGVPDGDGEVIVNIYGGQSVFAAINLFGSFLSEDNQEAFEKRVSEVVEALGDKFPKAYKSIISDGTKLI